LILENWQRLERNLNRYSTRIKRREISICTFTSANGCM